MLCPAASDSSDIKYVLDAVNFSDDINREMGLIADCGESSFSQCS